VLEQIKEIERAPAAHDFLLERLQRLRLWLRVERRDGDPRFAAAVGDPHTCAAPSETVLSRVLSAAPRRCWRSVMNALGSSGWRRRGVVHVAVVFEVGGQVVFGVAPAVGANDGDLAATDRVSERTQHAQLVGDALDPAVVVDDRGAPLARHDPIDRHGLRGGVETVLAGPLRVPGQQLERVHDRAVAGVGAAKLQGGQQPREHPAVVRGVRRAQHRPDALAKRLVVGFGLAHEVAQRAFADDRKQRRAECRRDVRARPRRGEKGWPACRVRDADR
jgi:hypothetical protein